MLTANRCYAVLCTLAVMLLSGCGEGDNTKTTGGQPANSSIDAAKYLLTEDPGDAQEVRQVRDSAKDGDRVVVVGRIGGREDPWVDGMAAFNIADNSMKPCGETGDDDCPRPWDYCCEPSEDRLAGVMFVKVVDDAGKPLAAGAKELLGLKELDTVVVEGKAKCDAEGNVSLLASGVFIRK